MPRVPRSRASGSKAHALRRLGLDRTAQHPLVVVGANASTEWLGSDVVVALDGVDNAEPLLAVAAAWALALKSRLRIVTVYEPGAPTCGDRRTSRATRPARRSRRLPLSDPRAVADVGLIGVDIVAVPDAVSVAVGLEDHLANAPARLLVLGGGHRGVSLSRGVARKVLDTATCPLLIVNRTS